MDVLARACAWLCQPHTAQAALFGSIERFESIEVALVPCEVQQAQQVQQTVCFEVCLGVSPVPPPPPPKPLSLNTSMMLQAKLPPFLSLKDVLALRASCISFSRTKVFHLLLNYCSKVSVRKALESHQSAEKLVLSPWQPPVPGIPGIPGRRMKSKKPNGTFSCCCGTCCPSNRDKYRGSGCLDCNPRDIYLEPLFGVLCRPVIWAAGEVGHNMFLVARAVVFHLVAGVLSAL